MSPKAWGRMSAGVPEERARRSGAESAISSRAARRVAAG